MSPWTQELLIFAAFFAISIAATWPLAAHMRTHITDYGIDDPLLYTRFIRCAHDWMLGIRHGNLFDFDFYFPHPMAMTTSDPALGIAVTTLPLRAFTDDYVLIVNIATLASFPLTAHGTYLFIKALWPSRPAAFLGGLLFAFCFFRIRHLDHPNVLQMQWLPYSLAFLHRMGSRPSPANTALTALFFTASLCASCNVGLYVAPLYLIIVPFVVLTALPRLRLLVAARVAGAGLVALVFVYAVYRNYWMVSTVWMSPKERWEIVLFSASIENFWAVPPASRLYASFLAKNASPEGPMFLGAVTVVLASVGFFARRSLNRRVREAASSGARAWLVVRETLRAIALSAVTLLGVYAALVASADHTEWVLAALALAAIALLVRGARRSRTRGPSPSPLLLHRSALAMYGALGLFYAVVTLGPSVRYRERDLGTGIWGVMVKFPGYASVRTPGRFYFITVLCLVVVAGYGLYFFLRAIPAQRVRRVLAGAVTVAGLLELCIVPVPMRRVVTLDRAPAVYSALQAAPDPGAVLELPTIFSQESRKPMLFANLHHHPTVNAVAGFSLLWPDRTVDGNLRGDQGMRTLQFLNAAGLRYVIVHRKEIESDEQLARYRDYLARLNAPLLGTYGDDDLYELPPPPPTAAPSPATIRLALEQGKPQGPRAWPPPTRDPLVINVIAVSRASQYVYTPGLTKFRMTLDEGGKTFERPLYFAPFLVHPLEPQVVPRQLDLDLSPGHHVLKVRIEDEAGVTWLEQDLAVDV